MFAALQSFLNSNQFGKSYSDIDQEELAALDLRAQASTAESAIEIAARQKRKLQQQRELSPLETEECDLLTISNPRRKEVSIRFPNNARDILSDTSSIRCDQTESIRPLNRRCKQQRSFHGSRSPSIRKSLHGQTSTQQQPPGASRSIFMDLLAGACCFAPAAHNDQTPNTLSMSLTIEQQSSEGGGSVDMVANERSRVVSKLREPTSGRNQASKKYRLIMQPSIQQENNFDDGPSVACTSFVMSPTKADEELEFCAQDSGRNELLMSQVFTKRPLPEATNDSAHQVSFLKLQSRLSSDTESDGVQRVHVEDAANGPDASFIKDQIKPDGNGIHLINNAREHQRLAAQIRTRARSKTHYRKKVSPYAATTSIVQNGEQIAGHSFSSDAENTDANAAYQSFTSQHDIQESYFNTSANGSGTDGSISAKKKRKSKLVNLDSGNNSRQRSPSLAKRKQSRTKAKASQIAARKLAKHSVTERDITVFGLKTGKKSAKLTPQQLKLR